MEDILKSTLKVRGGMTPYGVVSLSGDSNITIFHLIQSFFSDKKVILENVPRSGMVLDFIAVLKEVGVDITWNNETSLSVTVPQEVAHDLTTGDISYKFTQILIPAILFKKGVCIVPLSFRNEAKFYRSLGFDVDLEGESITLRRNFVKGSVINRQVNINSEELYFAASRIFINYFNPNLAISYDDHDYRLNKILKMSSENRIFIPYNQSEFNLFVSLASLTSAEVTIENYNLSESLQFLMVFDEVAGNYEVEGNKLKVWRHQKSLNDLYEFLSLTPDAIGYLIAMLSLISQKQVSVVCRKTIEIEDIITELNIMGCKLSYVDGPENAVITVRPVNNISAVKSEIANPDWGGVLIFGAVASRGYSRISNFNLLAYSTQYLMENLSSLNLDISI